MASALSPDLEFNFTQRSYPALQRLTATNGRGSGKAATLLEILRTHAEGYVRGTYALALAMQQITSTEGDFRQDEILMARIKGHLSNLLAYCDDLPLTAKKIEDVLELIEHRQNMTHWKQAELNFLTPMAEIRSRLEDELSLRLFFTIPEERARFFDRYEEGWEKVIQRFGDTVTDIEEMCKCFALSRYPGAVFHSLLVVESGVLHLGEYIEVTDPKRGWDATCKKLKALVDGGRNSLSPKFAGHFEFLEQVNQCIQAMKHAWRNKVNHVDGKLVVMKPEFTPDIAEEIMMASRAFMRRLATEMPE